MAYWEPDSKLEEAIKFIESLEKTKENELVIYYIEHLKDYIEDQNEKLIKYNKWFAELDRFLPNRNSTIY